MTVAVSIAIRNAPACSTGLTGLGAPSGCRCDYRRIADGCRSPQVKAQSPSIPYLHDSAVTLGIHEIPAVGVRGRASVSWSVATLRTRADLPAPLALSKPNILLSISSEASLKARTWDCRGGTCCGGLDSFIAVSLNAQTEKVFSTVEAVKDSHEVIIMKIVTANALL